MSSIVSFNRRFLNLLNDPIALSSWLQRYYQTLNPMSRIKTLIDYYSNPRSKSIFQWHFKSLDTTLNTRIIKILNK